MVGEPLSKTQPLTLFGEKEKIMKNDKKIETLSLEELDAVSGGGMKSKIFNGAKSAYNWAFGASRQAKASPILNAAGNPMVKGPSRVGAVLGSDAVKTGAKIGAGAVGGAAARDFFSD